MLFRAVTAPKMQANRLQVEAAKARGRPLKSNEAAGRSLASVARPPWQPQWTWLPLEDCGEFCFSTKWFWRTLATARPATGGPGTSADAAAKRQREWERCPMPRHGAHLTHLAHCRPPSFLPTRAARAC